MTSDVSTGDHRALALMRAAMDALDGANAPGGIPACYLQMAIDGLERQLADGPAHGVGAAAASAR